MDNQVSILLTAKSMLGKGFNHAQKEIGVFSGSAIKSLGSIQTALAALGTGLVVKQAVGDFKQYQSALNDMAKVTDQSLQVIDERIMALPPALGSATELMSGYYNTISAGITGAAESMDFLVTASKASNAAHVEQGEVVKALSKFMAGYEGQIQSATEAADLLFAIEKEGQTTFEELVPVIGDLATNSKQLNVEQSELGAAMALLTQTSGSTSMAATKYNAVLMGLFKPTERMRDVISEMGYESGALMVKQNGLVGTLKLIKEHTQSANIPLAKLFENKEALTGIAALAAGNFQKFADKVKVLEGSAGGLDRAFGKWRKTFEATEQAFVNTWKIISIELGKELAIPLQESMEGFTEYFLGHKDEVIAGIKGIGQTFAWTAARVGDLLAAYAKFAGFYDSHRPELIAKENLTQSIRLAEHKVEQLGGQGKSTIMAKRVLNSLRVKRSDYADKLLMPQQQAYFDQLNADILKIPGANQIKDESIGPQYATGGGFGGEPVKVPAPTQAATPGSGPGSDGSRAPLVDADEKNKFLETYKTLYQDLGQEDDRYWQGRIGTANANYDELAAQARQYGQDTVIIEDARSAEIAGINKAKTDHFARIEREKADAAKESAAKSTEQWQTYFENFNAGVASSWEADQDARANRLTAEDLLYDQMGSRADGWFDHQVKILDAQRQEYERLGVDKNQIDQWYTQEFKALQEEQTRANGSMVDGFILGMQEMGACQRTWAEEGISLVRSLANEMQNGLAGVFKALVTDINDVDDALKAAGQSIVDNLINTGSQIAADKVMGGIMEIGGTTLDSAWTFGKKMLGLAEGAWTVNEDGVAMLHRGEKVVPAHAAKFLDETDVIKWDARPVQKEPTAVGVTEQRVNDYKDWMNGPMMAPALGIGTKALSTALLGGNMTDFVQGVTAGLPGMVAGIIRDQVLDHVVKYQTDWGKYGGQILGAAGNVALGPIGGAILGFVGSIMGEGLADLMDAREHEQILDALEKAKGWGNVTRADVAKSYLAPGAEYSGVSADIAANEAAQGHVNFGAWSGPSLDVEAGEAAYHGGGSDGPSGGGYGGGPIGGTTGAGHGDNDSMANFARGGNVDVAWGPMIDGSRHGLARVGDKEHVLTEENTANVRGIVTGLAGASLGAARLLEMVNRMGGIERLVGGRPEISERPLHITVQLGNEELDTHIDRRAAARANHIYVKATKRGMVNGLPGLGSV